MYNVYVATSFSSSAYISSTTTGGPLIVRALISTILENSLSSNIQCIYGFFSAVQIFLTNLVITLHYVYNCSIPQSNFLIVRFFYTPIFPCNERTLWKRPAVFLCVSTIYVSLSRKNLYSHFLEPKSQILRQIISSILLEFGGVLVVKYSLLFF